MSFANSSNSFVVKDDLPPLPQYSLRPMPTLIPGVPDMIFKIFFPSIVYWVFSSFFHFLDVNGYFAEYKVHTPAELQKRNRATMRQVILSVLQQQALQISLGLTRFFLGPPQIDFVGREEHDIAAWAQKLRIAQRALPFLLTASGLDVAQAASKLSVSHPTLSGLILGGRYPWLTQSLGTGATMATVPTFAAWELAMAKTIYYALVPLIQFGVSIFVIDSWQYLTHRLMHMNKFMYTRYHATHHRLFVPYAFGALYNHPVEGFLLDTLGAVVSSELGRLSIRQATIFFTLTTIKTIDDHSGYSFPWDPLQHLTPNNNDFHDIHHQSWGIKHNFSQPFLIVWDHFLGTAWDGGDTTERYARSRAAAEFALAQDKNEVAKTQVDPLTDDALSLKTGSTAKDAVQELAQEAAKNAQPDLPVKVMETGRGVTSSRFLIGSGKQIVVRAQ